MDVWWLPAVLGEFRDLPRGAQQRLGYQLSRVQHGLEPSSWKPMASVGAGCREIRVTFDDGIVRSLYVFIGTDPRYVVPLAAFVKKTTKTPLQVISTARERLALVRKQMEELS